MDHIITVVMGCNDNFFLFKFCNKVSLGASTVKEVLWLQILVEKPYQTNSSVSKNKENLRNLELKLYFNEK